MSKVNNLKTGCWGESLAVDYIKSKGYFVLEKNFKCKIGEIDIIAKVDNTIVFIEVKTRTNDRFGMPREAVNVRKQNIITNVAMFYIKFKRLFGYSLRFDIIEILGNDITHLKNCF